MRKTVAIFGTLLIAAVLIISGSAAAWVYAISQTNVNCTDPDEARFAPNSDYASLGKHLPPADPVLGWILLDLGSINVMPANQDFTVFAQSSVEENYTVYVSETTDLQYKLYVGSGWDTEDLIFTTPLNPQATWYRYIYLEGLSGVTAGAGGGDYAYGPDIDAVGWDM